MQIQEYKRTCNSCGKVWHSLVSREREMEDINSTYESKRANSLWGLIRGKPVRGRDMACCSSNIDMKNKESGTNLENLRKCPNCGSKNYTEDIVTYEK